MKLCGSILQYTDLEVAEIDELKISIEKDKENPFEIKNTRKIYSH